MPKARHLVAGATFEPERLAMLGQVLDEVWESTAAEFSSDPQEIEEARIRLAIIIIDLAKDRQLGETQIACTAARLLRQSKAPSRSESQSGD